MRGTPVLITGIDTLPRADHRFKSPGEPTRTAMIIDLANRRVSVLQLEVGRPQTWREAWGHDLVVYIPGYPGEYALKEFLENDLAYSYLMTLCDGYRPVWDTNHKHVLAFMTKGACRAYELLRQEIARWIKEVEHYTLFNTGSISYLNAGTFDEAVGQAERYEPAINTANAAQDVPIFAHIAYQSGLENIGEFGTLTAKEN